MQEQSEKKKIEQQDTPEGVSAKDKRSIIIMSLIAICFSIRGGEFPGCVFASLLQIASCFIYGFGIVFLFIGLTKKTFKYNPTKVQIIRWVVIMAAIFAFSEMLHEGYLILTAQMPVGK